MKSRIVMTTLVFCALATGLSACGASETESEMPAAQSGMPGMPNMPAASADPAAAATHAAEGTLNSVNLDAGTANISHGPVASANWPQMTMSFKLANPDSARSLQPGQRIRFEFTIQSGMSATVTTIEAID